MRIADFRFGNAISRARLKVHGARFRIFSFPVLMPWTLRFEPFLSSIKFQATSAGCQKPGTMDKYPKTSYQLPETSNQYPKTSDQRPVPSTQYPETSDQYPVPSIQQPVPGNQLPVPCIHRTGTGNRRPEISKSGFTLLEILLAISILAVVVTTVLGSFNAVFSTTDTLDNSARIYTMAKTCLNRMIADLEALTIAQRPFYKPPDYDDPPDPYRIEGATAEADGTSFAFFRFASRAHLPMENSKRTGIAAITYYIMAKEDGQPVLKRSDTLYPYPSFEENSRDPVLCERVKSLAFTYYDTEGSDYESWDSDSENFNYATPTAIEIKLEIGDETEFFTFKTMVKLPVYREKSE
jgi:general secretion pathway protein J